MKVKKVIPAFGFARFLAGLATVLFLLLSTNASAFVKPADGTTVPDFDTRIVDMEKQGVPFRLSETFLLNLERQGFLWTANTRTGALKSVMALTGALWPETPGGAPEIARAFIHANERMFGLPPGGTDNLVVASAYTTKHNGMRHVWFVQTHEGHQVFNGRIGVHLDCEGRVFAASADDMAFTFSKEVAADITAMEAVRIAAAAIEEPFENSHPTAVTSPPSRTMVFEEGHLGSPPAAELVLLSDGGHAKPAWMVTVESGSYPATYLVMVDGLDGEVLLRKNQRLYASGYVFPGDPITDVDRVLIDFGPTAESPDGWVGTDNLTRGNNVNAYHDPGLYLFLICLDGTPEDVSPPPVFQEFDYPCDLTGDPSDYKDASITNLFYLNNFIHDYLYRLGFDEPAGNYQETNFVPGGAGGDPVNAEGQDGYPDCENTLIPNTNNANFMPSPDGDPGTMQMYVWTLPDPYRDGDFDRDIVVHEYCHGLSNRLVGGPSCATCLGNHQGGSMGEGWSDFFPASLSGDDRVGEYASGWAAGIRTFPYGQSPYTFGDLGEIYDGGCQVHADGEIWAATLWQLRADYMLVYGPQGRTMFEQNVVDSMKIMASSPSFLDARDGMIQAAINNGEDECVVWQIFADRGMGNDASVAGNGCDAVTEGYEVPVDCACVYPQPPDDLQALAPGGPQVELTWSSQAASGAVAYQLLRSDTGCGGMLEVIDSVQEPNTGFIDQVPGPGVYGYVVRAVPAQGSLCASESPCVQVVTDCTPGAPDVGLNSFKGVKTGAVATLTWDSSGSGEWNIHITGNPASLESIHADSGSVDEKVSEKEYQNATALNPGEIMYIQVFGADNCTGESVP